MRRFYMTFLFVLPLLLFSQGENDNWYFGDKAAVNFSSYISPTNLNNSQMTSAVEACGTVSDANGKLLFYTNGSEIWNRDHQIMQNGAGLTGWWSSEQLVIVKHPGNQNQYYIFTTGFINATSTSKIAYTVVDMSQGSLGMDGLPLGKVVDGFKNVPVIDNNGNFFKTEAIAVAPTSSGDFWILIPNGLHLYSYLFSDILGFNNGNPVISDLNFPASLSETDLNHFGIKVSPRLNSSYNFSNYICVSSVYNPDSKNVVYSFNNSTGKITTDYRLNVYSINSYIPEFNKDSSVLFLGYNKLYAVNLVTSTSASPVFSQVYDFGTNTIVGSIQRNKYNDIYFSVPVNGNYLGKINNPNVYGSGITVNMNYFNLGVNNGVQNLAKYGLPQLIEPRVFESRCVQDITLTSPETSTSYVYRAPNTIKTENNYQVSPSSQNIAFKAGNNITLYPNTHIQLGAFFSAKIEDCLDENGQRLRSRDNQKSISIYLDEEKSKDDISIFPNPTSDILNIKTDFKINNVSVVDVTGRKINVKLENNKLDVKSLATGTYLISIETEGGISSQKFIKK
ncbi:T9SS type A sorting domain-containing protein [Chryseobacterium sp. RG1]|uniref:T9SS type A sorting domain-containing protein n=1 Tax=Chryseobacterium tagetis TaxID=2801334 RepID=A0ABS8A4G7_9FLAO|nr:T9SS type A sorting domain-containing protein [Chryseobacterium tagetis]MCA6068887.1 T9SS type A sorting domain-containing protein [Chryseobacterium tagetis]